MLAQTPLARCLSTLLCGSLCGLAAAADRYQIDAEHTYSTFSYQHWGLSTQSGRFDKNSGSITLDLAAQSGALEIEIEAASVNTGSEAFNKMLRSRSFFDSDSFPTIRFVSDQMVFEQGELKKILGQLSIRDITRPVTIEVTHFHCRYMLLYLKSACGANGNTTIRRSDYQLGRYVPFVSDEVNLSFNVEAIKAAAPPTDKQGKTD